MLSGDGFFGDLVGGALTATVVLGVPILVLFLANHVFHVLAPADFNQVSIVRRAGVVGGTLLGGGIVLASVLAGKGFGFNILADTSEGGIFTFYKLFGSQLAWILPINLLRAPAPAYWLVFAGVLTWFLPTISAAAYWRGLPRIGAITIAILIVPLMALALVYAFTIVIWFVHVLNIWSIAVAGLIYQRYRNSQLDHG